MDRKALRTSNTKLTFENVMKTLTVLAMIAMILFFICYDSILHWIWCEIFHRCVNGVPY